MFFGPLLGWRRVTACDSRTRVGWAWEVRRLLDEDYPHAQKVKFVCDNLNTYNIASLYEAFLEAEAHRLARRLEIYHTPRNGSSLNVAGIELNILARQWLDRHMATAALLRDEIAAWEVERNAVGGRVEWSFTTADARIKLHHLYPRN